MYKEIATDVFKLKMITYVVCLYILYLYILYVFEWILPQTKALMKVLAKG